MQRRAITAAAVFVAVALIMGGGAYGQDDDDFYYGTFPDGFLWGTATSAYQIEGGWDAEGKGESIWDTWTHACNSANCDNGDVACDSFGNYLDDVRIMKDMGVGFYRFSISWARVLPTGSGTVNEVGVQYYNNLIDALLAEGITPMVTLYHWDLPQVLEDKGGWLNETLVDDFREYADLCYSRFGDRVKWWLTFNEPYVTTYLGYAIGVFAPGGYNPGAGEYRAAHTIIKSHAEAWHLYNDDYRATQNGLVSITLDSDWKAPKTDSAEDQEASEIAMQFKLGWYAHPIFVNGDYPEIMKEMVAAKSQALNITEDRLPVFTQAEKARIVGTHDYFGLNHYTTQLVSLCPTTGGPSYDDDKGICEEQDDSWPTSGSSWLRVVPWGMRRLLNFIKENYENPEIIITENGVSDRNATQQDAHRVYFYRHYIDEALKAIDIDDVRVIGYTAWSVMDNFEWGSGYDEKFGLHYVDFNDPERKRIPKDSARAYATIISDNGFSSASQMSAGILTALSCSLASLLLR